MRRPSVKILPGLAAILLLANAQPAAAAPFFEEKGAWEIGPVDAASCAMMMEYGGDAGTRLVVMSRTDAVGYGVALSNPRWSATADVDYDVRYTLGGTAFTGGLSTGYSDGPRKGFVSHLPAGFSQQLANGGMLSIYLGETLIDQLPLNDGREALASLQRCTQALGSESVAGSASGTGDRTAVTAPTPRDQQDWAARIVSAKSANSRLRAIESGVSMKIGVTPDGRVDSCSISASSGNAMLDRLTCSEMQRYARYNPARDATGQPIAATTEATIVYQVE